MNRSPVVFPKQETLLLISINKTIGTPGLELYDAVRYSWTVSRPRAARARYVLAVAHGVVQEVYEAEDWLSASKSNFPDIPEGHGNWKNQKRRSGFRGRRAPEAIRDLYCGRAVPPEHLPGQIGFHYVNC